MMTHNGSDVIAPASSNAGYYFSLPPHGGSSFSPLSLLYHVGVVVFVGVVVVTVMFNTLHLAEICTLPSTF